MSGSRPSKKRQNGNGKALRPKARSASGRAGGLATSANAEHMSKIGRAGGLAFHEKRGAVGSDRK